MREIFRSASTRGVEVELSKTKDGQVRVPASTDSGRVQGFIPLLLYEVLGSRTLDN